MRKIFHALCVFLCFAAVVCAAENQFVDENGRMRSVSDAYPLPTKDKSTVSVLGTFTLSIPLHTSVALPTAPTGARICRLFPSKTVNYGWSYVASGTTTPQEFLFEAVPDQGLFGYSDFTGWRFIGQTEVATATGRWER